jgi:hypothetical protein
VVIAQTVGLTVGSEDGFESEHMRRYAFPTLWRDGLPEFQRAARNYQFERKSRISISNQSNGSLLLLNMTA